MDAFIQLSGRVLRLPFFLATFAALTLYTLVGGILCVVWLFVVAPLLWLVLGVPFEFLSVAFRGGDWETMKHGFQTDADGWKSDLAGAPRYFRDLYDRLVRWFLLGPSN